MRDAYIYIAKLTLLFVFGVWAAFYIPTAYDWSCFKKRTGKIKVTWSCMIFSSAIYNKLNHFCNCHEDWVETSKLVKNSEQSRLKNNRFFPTIFWGSKDMPCGNNTFNVLSDTDDSRVFFYIEQDTTKPIYDGALTKLEFGSNPGFSRIKRVNDVKEENRQVIAIPSGVTINYLLDYDKVNVKIMHEFRQSIRFDSTYFQRNKVADYRLIDRDHNKCLASIRYEDYGKRFYFDVY